MPALFLAAGEPAYEGKPVSHWLSILRNPSAGSTNREDIRAAFRQAHAAILSIGPAALPYLAEDLDDRESVFVQGYRKLRQQLPSRVAQRLPDPQRKRRLPGLIVNQYFSDITRRAGTNVISVLIQLATSPVAEIRRTAVSNLGLVAGLDREQVIPLFAKGAFDTDHDVSREALDALCPIAPWDSRVEPILVEYLRNHHSHSFNRIRAIMALGSAAKSSRTSLESVRSLAGTNRWERAFATFADWQRSPTDELGEQAIASFRYAVESPHEYYHGASSLHSLNDYLRPAAAESEMAARVFATALRDSDEEIRNEAAEQLEELGPAVRVAVPALVEALHDPSEKVRDSALGALRHAGEEARAAIPRVIELVNKPPHRWRPALLLERIGPGASNAIPALIKATRRGDVLERRAPLDALAAIAPNDPRVRDILLKSLRDRRDHVRWFASDALGTTRDSSRSVIDALEHRFHNDEVMDVRLAAAHAMLEIDPGLGPRLVAPLAELIELMEADDWQSPAWAARLLGRIGPDASSVVAALAGLLVHKYPNVRVAAAEALARVQPDRKTQSIELLRALLKHEQPSARLSAAKTLWRLSPEDAPEIAAVATELLATPGDMQYAARLLVEMGPAARSVLPRLKQALESGVMNRQSRHAIWESLEAIQKVK